MNQLIASVLTSVASLVEYSIELQGNLPWLDLSLAHGSKAILLAVLLFGSGERHAGCTPKQSLQEGMMLQ